MLSLILIDVCYFVTSTHDRFRLIFRRFCHDVS